MEMDKKLIVDKIMEKSNYSGLVRSDVERIVDGFLKKGWDEEDIVKKTREVLRVNFSGFSGKKLYNWKDKGEEEVLKKHLSTRERYDFYGEVYGRLLGKFNGMEISVIDLGAGVNGFSYDMMRIDNSTTQDDKKTSGVEVHSSLRYPSKAELKLIGDIGNDRDGKTDRDSNNRDNRLIDAVKKSGKDSRKINNKNLRDVNYLGVEAVGQLVDLMNNYFEVSGLRKNGKAEAIHASLFEIEKIKKIISDMKKPRVVFMFKVVDALEKIERNYTLKFLDEIMPLVDRLVISFATESWFKRKKFFVQRNWLIDFINQKWHFVDDFNLGGERYFVIENGKSKGADESGLKTFDK
jgi:hypothetical protein